MMGFFDSFKSKDKQNKDTDFESTLINIEDKIRGLLGSTQGYILSLKNMDKNDRKRELNTYGERRVGEIRKLHKDVKNLIEELNANIRNTKDKKLLRSKNQKIMSKGIKHTIDETNESLIEIVNIINSNGIDIPHFEPLPRIL